MSANAGCVYIGMWSVLPSVAQLMTLMLPRETSENQSGCEPARPSDVDQFQKTVPTRL